MELVKTERWRSKGTSWCLYDEPHGPFEQSDEQNSDEQNSDEQNFDEQNFDEQNFDEQNFDEQDSEDQDQLISTVLTPNSGYSATGRIYRFKYPHGSVPLYKCTC